MLAENLLEKNKSYTVFILFNIVFIYHLQFFSFFLLKRSSQMQAFDVFNYTVKMPVGVAGLISPWNLPMYLLTFKLAPAIVAGNTVVAKPSEMTSVTAWKLAEVFNAAGRMVIM